MSRRSVHGSEIRGEIDASAIGMNPNTSSFSISVPSEGPLCGPFEHKRTHIKKLLC